MKTFTNNFRNMRPNLLVLMVVIVTLLGISFKMKAQSPVLGVNLEKINSSMKIKVKNYDMDVLIPKLNMVDLTAFTEVSYNHMVYVTDENPGFYMFFNNKWEKQKISSVLNLVEMNLAMGHIEANDFILQTAEANNKKLLDYNSHINNLYRGFQFEQGSNQMAIHIGKERK
jgi:hypothetical protein